MVELGVNPDIADYDEVTPFNLLSINRYLENQLFNVTLEKLITLDVRVDYADIKGRTPFLNYYENSLLERAYRMLDLGANVN